MRIVGGEFRGRRLRAPKGRNTRPTPARVREALFQILGDSVVGAKVCELFGGTGSLGLEALSRGAARAVFLETNRAALDALTANVRALAVADRVAIHRRSAFDLPKLADPAEPFDLLFCDPPHRLLDDPRSRARLEALLGRIPLAADATVLLEHRAGALGSFRPAGLRPEDLRQWGSTGMALYRPAPE